MGHTLKLNIYTFYVKDTRKGKHLNFYESLEKMYGKSEEPNLSLAYKELMDSFANDFFKAFGTGFLSNEKDTKAMALQDFNINHSGFTIDGMIKGGLTGIKQDVYKKDDSKDPVSKIDIFNVSSLPYYFKIWIPRDAETGLIMVQSYTELGLTSLFSSRFKGFFKTKEQTLTFARHIPKEYKESFLKRSLVSQVTFIKSKPNKEARNAFSTLLAEEENLKITINISGFKSSIQDFWDNFHKKQIKLPTFDGVDIGDDYFDVVATYEDNVGRKTQAKLSKGSDFFPTLILDEQLKKAGTDFADYEKIRTHTDHLLNTIKDELKYNTIEDVG